MTLKVLANTKSWRAALGLSTILLWPAAKVAAQRDAGDTAQRKQSASDSRTDDQSVYVEHVQGRVYMLVGAGANITVQVGDEAVVLIDSGRPEMSADVLRAIRKLSNRPIQFVIDTSMDADHIGGNESIAKAGHYDSGQPGEKPGAAIVAQLNVLDRLTDQKAPSGEVPTDTYRETWSLFNDEAIMLNHARSAHTDGDSYVFFRRSDVISTGELFQPSLYPVIEVDRGGSINGIIAGLNEIIGMMVPRENEEGGTYLIPGHGRICDRTDIVNYRDAMSIIRARIQALVSKGMTLEQVKATKPTLDYDGMYGSDTGPWTTNMFVDALYAELHKTQDKQEKENPKDKKKGPSRVGGKG